MSREYVWKRQDSYSKPSGMTLLMTAATVRVVAGTGPFDLTQDGEVVAQDKSRGDVLSLFKQAISHREIGSVFRIRKGNENVSFTSRAVRIDEVSDANTTNGNEHADIYWNWIRTEFSEYHPRYAGSYVCKYVAGSTVLSQHSYGNAVDVFFDSIAHQEAVWNEIRQGKCPVPVAHAISLRHITDGQGNVSSYGGETHYHLHADFLPQYSGACGVRG